MPRQKNFPLTLKALRNFFRTESLILIGVQATQLIYLDYQSNSLICEHMITFCKQYLSLKETLKLEGNSDDKNKIMIPSFISAILFLKTFWFDPNNNFQIQECHSLKVFRLKKLENWVMDKDTCCKSKKMTPSIFK